ncbi:hypothetical protein RSOLAG1IB_12466 [Rhizoctonia solani AG-1 IB]|uniref:Ricin B lectin domain-containing protein n=1 Tax=Thanatephorus cucumeris (strain AG1-IB / isolate 7/3/14) TaxID=1108050 RepID=A0A0B7FUV6_THACB|nr:hypothetical protein RSOLAG1IB_12466 [Rhizoctonia solani AG-1 IB]
MTTYSGAYRIKNAETGTYMTMTSTGTKTSIVCAQADKEDKKSLWRLVATRDGKYKLRNLEHNLEAHTGQDFSMIGEPNGHSWFVRDGTGGEKIIHTGNNEVILELVKATKKVQLKVDKSQKNQRWIFETIYLVAPATYVIKNVKTGTVMDLEGAKEGEGVRIIGFHKNGSANQKWNLQPGDGINMTICSAATNTYAGYPTFEQGATLRSSAKPHNYSIIQADKGFYIAPVEKPDHVLDLSGAGEADNTEICLWAKHGGDHQKWHFETP